MERWLDDRSYSGRIDSCQRCRTCERDIQYLGPKAEIIEERGAEQKQGQSEET